MVWWKIPSVREASATNVVSAQCFGKSLNYVERKNKKKITKNSMLALTVYIHRDSSCIFFSGNVFWILVYCFICLSCLVRKQVVINWLRKENVFSTYFGFGVFVLFLFCWVFVVVVVWCCYFVLVLLLLLFWGFLFICLFSQFWT